MADPALEAADPNTKTYRLAELLGRFPGTVLANPAFPLIMLENPSCLAETKSEQLLKLLLDTALPEYLVHALTQHCIPAVATSASMHVALGEEVTDWEPLLKSLAVMECSEFYRTILERHGLIPLWLMPYLEPLLSSMEPEIPELLNEEHKQRLKESSGALLGSIARSSASAEEVTFLLELAPEVVAQFAAANPITPLFWLKRLMESPQNWFQLAMNSAMTPEMLADLFALAVAEKQSAVLDQIARNPNCTHELAIRLQREDINLQHLARFYSSEELEELYRSGHQWVAWYACTRNDAPRWLVVEGLMERIHGQTVSLPWFCGLLATEDQRRLSGNVRSANWFTRFAIAIHPGSKSKTLEKLTTDANRFVRFAAKARLSEPIWSFTEAIGHG